MCSNPAELPHNVGAFLRESMKSTIYSTHKAMYVNQRTIILKVRLKWWMWIPHLTIRRAQKKNTLGDKSKKMCAATCCSLIAGNFFSCLSFMITCLTHKYSEEMATLSTYHILFEENWLHLLSHCCFFFVSPTWPPKPTSTLQMV